MRAATRIAPAVVWLLVVGGCGPTVGAAVNAPAATNPPVAVTPAPAPVAPPATTPSRCPLGTTPKTGPAEDEHKSGAEWCARPDGTKHGGYVGFWEPGKRAVTGDFVDGRRVGRWTRYFPHGEVVSEELYRDGQPDGVWVAYSLRRIFAFATCFDRGRRVWQVSSAEVGSEAEARAKPCP